MLFPKNRVYFTKTYQVKNDAEGWIVLDLTALDLEGANKVYLPVADLDALKAKGDKAADKLRAARMLLGAEPDAAGETTENDANENGTNG